MSSTGFFTSGLLLLFIGLKLGKVIEWSWIWVLAPIWVPLVLAFMLIPLALAKASKQADEDIYRPD